MSAQDMPLEKLLNHLERLANASLTLWDLPDGATARLINVSENATYLVEAKGEYKSILRIHREKYHSRRAIECELGWITALAKAEAVVTPGHYLGRDGQAIQKGQAPGLAEPRYMVLFHFVAGSQPDEAGDLAGPFEELGEIAARTHIHSVGWPRPTDFERLTWDVDAVFGDQPTWGNWRNGPNVDAAVREVLEKVEATVKRRLAVFGQSADRYGLIHADMRLANLLVEDGRTRLIDFDDCGFGWFLYDFATGISFMEEDPRVPLLKAAWVRGYRKIRPLSEAENAEIDTFVMLRRLALLAWIGSHIEAPEPQAMAPDFARVTAELGTTYLKDFNQP
jgi:Ser/Thr protein kinase RdoA (MazF antagonist)